MKRSNSRRCSRASCTNAAIKTLTYIYSDSTAVLGPLSTYVDNSGPSEEDLMAIANAVREVVTSDSGSKTMQPELGRRGHLRVLPSN